MAAHSLPRSLTLSQQAPFRPSTVSSFAQVPCHRIALVLPETVLAPVRHRKSNRARTARSASASYSSDGFGAVGRPKAPHMTILVVEGNLAQLKSFFAAYLVLWRHVRQCWIFKPAGSECVLRTRMPPYMRGSTPVDATFIAFRDTTDMPHWQLCRS